ncbi:YhgE/Pip family protein, partial [Deinococcus petrolearius]
GAATLAARSRGAAQGAAAAARGAATLKTGSAQLAAGTAQVAQGAASLATASRQAAASAQTLAGGAAGVARGVETLAQGNLKIKQALGDITGQLPKAADLKRLDTGAATLAARSGELSGGLKTLAQGSGELRQGAASLRSGARQLSAGLSELSARLPAQPERLGGDPAGLSASVLPVTQTFAPVANNGAGFAPYFLALSLWVGVTLTTFIFPYQQLARSGKGTSQWARALRKAAVPALLVCVQALLVVAGVHALGVEFVHPAQVVVTALASSLTFLALVLALVFLFGSAGRLVALVLLVLQLAASGGSYPVELAPGIFGALHGWLPVTQSVGAFRHAITGAYQGQYPALMLSLAGMFAVSVALWLPGRRRWEFVPDEHFRPLIASPPAARTDD